MKFFFDEAEIWERTKQSVFDEINKMGLPLVIAGRSSATSPMLLCNIKERTICHEHSLSYRRRRRR